MLNIEGGFAMSSAVYPSYPPAFHADAGPAFAPRPVTCATDLHDQAHGAARSAKDVFPDIWAYYASLRDGVVPPPRHRFDPMAIVPALPGLTLMDVLRPASPGMPAGLDFRFRLVGSDYGDLAGLNLTGKWLTEVSQAPLAAALFDTLARVVADGVARLHHMAMPFPGRTHIAVESLHLPLLDEAGEIAFILSANRFPGMESFSSVF